ncbi:MAG: phospholipase D-like domain-containing protein [Dehalococcoidia bacterium]|nr:phospholipase D-like domain-containing protein [Dehalococcoidia bacterium]
MAISTSNKVGNVEIKLVAYHNCDDVQIFWRTNVDGQPDHLIPGCLGFMIERQRKNENGIWNPSEILRNRVGFQDQEVQTENQSQRSNIWPFQRYDWTDHGADNRQTVQYRVSALRLPAGSKIGVDVMESIADSGWTEPIVMSPDCGNGVSAYFNRGFVMSQFVSRMMRQNNWKPSDIKDQIKNLEQPLRLFLSGELRIALVNLLEEVANNPDLSLYAALYELSDEELIDKLISLGNRAHVVLANGSNKAGDGNKDARDKLVNAGVDVKNRMLASKGLGHNKFVVLTRSQDNKPIKAWTGSTNWAPTGLCTQVNNGILIENDDIAKTFYEQWQNLARAQNDFTPDLVAANARSPYTSNDIDVWFTRIRNPSKKYTVPGNDIQALIDLVNSAKEAIIYIMFQPGKEPLESIMKRSADIYVRGVVSTVSKNLEEEFQLTGIDKEPQSYKTALVQPEGIAKGFSWWVGEVTRQQFLYPQQNPAIGHAITHSKVIVIDPLRDDCKVITGSHNFSISASQQNDENFVVVHGLKALAEAYAVACMGTYSHYRWRAYVKDKTDAGEKIWQHLSSDPKWQESYLSEALKKHLSTWCGL